MRDYSLDFVKGFLVEVMVVYHCIEYFIGGDYYLLRYIDFVTTSFVFLSGFTIPKLYFKKYNADRNAIFSRLAIRGMKIIGLFLVINSIIHIIITKNYNGVHVDLIEFYRKIWYVLVPGDRMLSAFELLLPIAYTLLGSAILLKYLSKKSIIIFAIFIFICSMATGDRLFNLYYLSFGLNGLVLGFIPNNNRLTNIFYRRKWLSIIPVLLYFGAIFCLGKKTMVVYFLGTIAILVLTYFLGTVVSNHQIAQKTIVLLGQYSLFGYLIQIFFLQILFRKWNDFFSSGEGVFYAILVTTIFVWGACLCLDILRRKISILNKMYKFVF